MMWEEEAMFLRGRHAARIKGGFFSVREVPTDVNPQMLMQIKFICAFRHYRIFASCVNKLVLYVIGKIIFENPCS